MILSIGLASSMPAVFAETEIIFEENFDNGLNGWTGPFVISDDVTGGD